MSFDRQISKLLAKSLLIPVGISCFGFGYISSMEVKEDKEAHQEFEVKKSNEQPQELLNKKRRRTKAEKQADAKISECIKKSIKNEKLNISSLTLTYAQTSFEKKSEVFAKGIVPIHERIIKSIISDLRDLNKETPFEKDSNVHLLLELVRTIQNNIKDENKNMSYDLIDDSGTLLKSPPELDLFTDENLDLFNGYFAELIDSFVNNNKGAFQNKTAERLLKTLNIYSAGKWADEHPDAAKIRARMCIFNAINSILKEDKTKLNG